MWITLVLLAAIGMIQLRWQSRWRRLREQLQQAEQEHTALRQEHSLSYSETQARQEALFDNMSEGVLLMDANGRIQLVNRSLQDMFGLNRDVRGRTVLEAFRIRELDGLLERIKSEPVVQGVEMELPGLQERWLQVTAASVVNPQGDRIGSILVFHDLTRMKQLENTRQEFVANVSHELRTPLSLIKGYVETLLDGAKDDPQMSVKFLQTIEKHTDRLTYLIEDILTISRLESGQIVINRDQVDLRDLVQHVLEDLAGVVREREFTTCNQVPPELVVMGEGDRLEQVFFNLVQNAIKYGKQGGRVEIGAVALEDGQKVKVWVKDDGPGIPPEAQERVFERFYRVDRARSRETGGTGLGLSIVKHILQAHGGEVWLESQPGQGATFFFTLLRPHGTAAEPAARTGS